MLVLANSYLQAHKYYVDNWVVLMLTSVCVRVLGRSMFGAHQRLCIYLRRYAQCLTTVRSILL